MASTYSTNLRIELMVDGENSNTWGDKTNTNLNLLEQAVSGVASVAMTDADYTLTTSNAATDEARNAVITMTGTLTQARNVIVPSVDKVYIFKNSTTGGFSIIVKTSAGTGVTVPNGETAQVYCDATNVVLAETGGATTAILVGGGVGSLPVWTAATGSGSPVRATSPTISSPVINGTVTGTAVREKLTANRTYYVRTDGSDSNTGLANTAGGAFLTIQAALNVVDNSIDLNGYIATIQVADGTYTAGATASGSWTGDGDVYILGNLTTPANCIINTTSADCFVATKGATLLVSGFKITTTTSGCCVKANLSSYIAVGVMNYGACAESHLEAGTGATIIAGSNYTISGGAVSHLHCGAPGTILAGTITVTLTGTPAFSAYFAGVAEGTITVAGVTWSGAATGMRFLAHKNGIIDVGAGTITTLPGDVAGYSDVGGTYACTTGVQDAQYFGGPSTAPAVKVVPVADQDRHVILTGADASSGSPNPSIGVSGGALSIPAAVVGTGTVQCLANTATPAGGAVAFYMGASAVGIYWGSGVPSVAAARGSLYIRTDNGANTSLYINRDGGTTWAAITSA